jgi:hypothetical protein
MRLDIHMNGASKSPGFQTKHADWKGFEKLKKSPADAKKGRGNWP